MACELIDDRVLLFGLIERREGNKRRLLLWPFGIDSGRYGLDLGPDDRLVALVRPRTMPEMAWRLGEDGRPEILSVGRLPLE